MRPLGLPLLAWLAPACASSVASTPPPTQPAAAVPPAAASPGSGPMAALAFYEGRWQCETFDYPGKKPGPAATVRVDRVLDGSWYKVEMDIAAGPAFPTGWHTQEFKGYDPETRKWVMVGMMSQPGAWVTFGSDGWHDGRMIWTPAKPEAVPTRGVMTRISDDEYEHVEEQDLGHGFERTWSKHCTKRS